MPFEIVRNDIVNMQVDAIVNAANPRSRIGAGVDAGIHKKAGAELLMARKAIGDIAVGDAAITPGFQLDARHVIHVSGPVWQGGARGEVQLLRQCYDRALALACENGCESVAFPLLCAGNYGFPKRIALQTAIAAFSQFLMDHEMQIYLVVFGREAVELSEKLFRAITCYIDGKYILEKKLDEYGFPAKYSIQQEDRLERELRAQRRSRQMAAMADMEADSVAAPQFLSCGAALAGKAEMTQPSLMQMLEATDAGFSETLLKLIDRTGKKDAEIYKRANVDRKLFSKIKNNPEYRPSKATALAFALALELDLAETQDFIRRAGYALTHSSKFDIIVEYYIVTRNYDIFELNEVLFKFDQPLIGA